MGTVRVVARFAGLFCAALVLAGCGTSRAKIDSPPPPKSTFAGSELTPPRKAPPISLHDAYGRPVTLAGQRGRYVLVTFLYTHCPDVCPLIAENLNAALRRLGAERSHVRVLAVSVDPKGDTQAAVRAFVRSHRLGPEFHFLTGSRRALTPLWRKYDVKSVTVGGADPDHTLYVLLLDRAGRTRVLFDATATSKALAHDLRLLLA